MTELKQWDAGLTLFTRDGRQVEFVCAIPNGRFLVSELVEIDTYDGPSIGQGPLKIETELFEAPPRQIVDQEFAELDAKRQRLIDLNQKLQSEALDAERVIRERLNNLKKYNGLERLEDFVEGRITHVVLDEYSGYQILTLDQIEQKDDRGRNEGLRLISLFGRSNGDLSWNVNRWRDGSGSWHRCQPCCGEQDAIEVRKKWIADDLVDARTCLGTDKLWDLMKAVSAAIEHGVDVPADMMETYRAEKAKALAKQRSDLEKKIAEDQAKLAAIPAAA